MNTSYGWGCAIENFEPCQILAEAALRFCRCAVFLSLSLQQFGIPFMSYVVLARRLRPSRFEDLIGQETAAQTLRNAVLADRVAHAFLFSGSRGVGKTSAARILTRALNCLNPDNGDPCNSCENCVEINQNASPDIYEIDAASNRGIDNIRELRENVNYVPARCRYKIYIIDEAHMLTIESFNALLKTLEEPPSYVKFIFATTESHKIPQTIISRCQRYDFLRIPIKKMADFLEIVIRNEKLEISRKAIEMIARNSVGGMRDALTAIDQILSFSETSVSDQKVAQILGILDSESRFAFTEALLKKNGGEALRYFQQLQDYGHDTQDILADLLQTIKTTALVRNLGTDTALFQDISADDLEVFASIAKAVSSDELQQIFHILLELEEQMKRSAHTKICFEMAILQIASIEPLVGLPEIISGIKSIRSGEALVGTSSGNITFLKDAPEELALPVNVNSVGKHEHSVTDYSGVTKKLADASLIKSLLQSESKEKLRVADNHTYELNSEVETDIAQVTDNDKSIFTTQNDANSSVLETSVYPGKQIQNIDVNQQGFLRNTEIQIIQETPQTPEIKQIYTLAKETQEVHKTSEIQQISTQAEEAKLNKSENDSAEIEHENLQSSEKPSQEWIEFAAEVQKKSAKLASFVRNALPQSLSGTQLKLAFKSGNYPSMFTEQNRSLLEEIATECCGQKVHISCEITLIVTSMLTIVEHEQILLEQAREIKRKNAREFPQVKDILSVFTNSKISAIEFSDA